MAVTKEVEKCPDFPEESLTKAEQIDAILDELPDLSASELASYAIKMNYAASKGLLPQCTPQELSALKTISQKCIPDAPKQINLNASIKTEQVILGFLKENDKLYQATEARIVGQTVIELEQLDGLGEFKENFTTGEEEDGE